MTSITTRFAKTQLEKAGLIMENDGPNSTSTKKSKVFPSVEFTPIADAMKRLELTENQMTAALGYVGKNVVAKWREKGRAPKVAALAAEGLVRRQGQNKNTPRLILCKIEGANFSAIESVFKAMGISYKEI